MRLFLLLTHGSRVEVTSELLLRAAGAILVGGIAISVLTTPDPLWWQKYFSALGTFTDFSGYTFNAAVGFSGVFIIMVALRVRDELLTLAAAHGRKPSRVLIVLLTSAGVHLAAIGVMPINVDQFLHERAASGVMLSFLATLVTTFVLFRYVPRPLRRATVVIAVLLSIAIAIFVSGLVNLAAFEVAGFGLIFTWFGVLTRCIRRLLDEVEADAAADGAAIREQAGEDAGHSAGAHVPPRSRMGSRRLRRAGGLHPVGPDAVPRPRCTPASVRPPRVVATDRPPVRAAAGPASRAGNGPAASVARRASASAARPRALGDPSHRSVRPMTRSLLPLPTRMATTPAR